MMKRGTYVSRSVYQKVIEENKRLRSDLYSLVMMPGTRHAEQAKGKWNNYFIRRKQFNDTFIELIKQSYDKPSTTT
jgi:hypothetical protein